MPVIEVFADVACPFTHIGLRRLVEQRAALGRDDVTLLVRAWPLELVNGKPLDPAFIYESGWADAKKKAAIDELTSAIEAGNIARIRRAIDAIASVGPGARSTITELTAATRHDDPVVRWHAVRAIGLVGEGVAEVVPS